MALISFLGGFLIWSLTIIGLESYFFNFTFLFLWCFFVISLILQKKSSSSLNLMYIWAFSTALISCFIVEFGAYLSEIRIFGALSNATVKIGFPSMILLYISINFCDWLTKNIQPQKRLPKFYQDIATGAILMFSITAVLALMVVIIVYGTPNSHNVDRFYYWENIAPSWGRYLQYNLTQLAFILGVLFVNSNRKYIYALLLLFSLVIQFLGGEKFTGPFLSILFFFTPYLVMSKRNLLIRILTPRNLIILSLVFFSFTYIIYLSYLAIYGNNIAATKSFVERIALQSQVWWALDQHSELLNSDLSFDWLATNFFGFGKDSEHDVFGMYYIMKVIAPDDVFQRFFSNSVRFTMGTPVNYNFFFGYLLAPVICIFGGLLMGFSAWVLRVAIDLNDLFYSFIAIKFYYLVILISTMSDVQYLISLKFNLFIVFIVVYGVLLQGIKIKRKLHV